MIRTLEEAYPGCHNAVKFFENLRGINKYWIGLSRVLPHGFDECPLVVIREVLAAHTRYEWLPEVEHPDFKRYIVAKLGLL